MYFRKKILSILCTSIYVLLVKYAVLNNKMPVTQRKRCLWYKGSIVNSYINQTGREKTKLRRASLAEVMLEK